MTLGAGQFGHKGYKFIFFVAVEQTMFHAKYLIYSLCKFQEGDL
jgi:hypothetical protein